MRAPTAPRRAPVATPAPVSLGAIWPLAGRSLAWGLLAGAGLASVFSGVLVLTAGAGHLRDQVSSDWWLLLPLIAGFAVQVTLLAELRHRRRVGAAAAASTGLGAGTSTVGMLACCAHHVADLLPLAGATGAAATLTGLQRPIMGLGLAVNVVAIWFVARRLRRVSALCHTPVAAPPTDGRGPLPSPTESCHTP